MYPLTWTSGGQARVVWAQTSATYIGNRTLERGGEMLEHNTQTWKTYYCKEKERGHVQYHNLTAGLGSSAIIPAASTLLRLGRKFVSCQAPVRLCLFETLNILENDQMYYI